MLGVHYTAKKYLKAAKGTPLQYIETSYFGPEYHGDGVYTVVGPDPYKSRKYFARVTVEGGVISKVE